MRFSIIIPVYKSEDFIGPAIESCLDQREEDGSPFRDAYEVIVVNDGSPDGTGAVCDRYADRVVVIHQENAGPGSARNKALEAARGEFCVFLDGDDLLFPWTLRTYRAALEAHPDGVLFGGTNAVFWTGSPPPEPEAPPVQSRRHEDWFAGKVHFLPSECMMRTDVCRAAGGFIEIKINAADVDMWMRVGDAGPFVHVLTPHLCARRLHPENRTHNPRGAFRGIMNLLQRERKGDYPGGSARRRDRERILCMYVSAVTLAVSEGGAPIKAMRVYFAAMRMMGGQRRLGYLALTPLYVLLPFLRPMMRSMRRRQVERRLVSEGKLVGAA